MHVFECLVIGSSTIRRLALLERKYVTRGGLGGLRNSSLFSVSQSLPAAVDPDVEL